MSKRVFVVKKSISGSNAYKKLTEYSEGDVVVGKFVGYHECQYGKQNPKVQVVHAEFADGSGETFVGKTLVINHCGSIEHAMKEINEGDDVQFVYTGKITLEKGPYKGKEAHTFQISTVDLSAEENYDL